MRVYSDPKRETDLYALPDVEVFEMTAEEVVERDEDLMWEVLEKFPFASMNSRDRAEAIAWAIEQSGAKGGWFWWTCLPGCLPDSELSGPFATAAEAIADAQAQSEE